MEVKYKWTDKEEEAKEWLEWLPMLVACDFEVASRYTLAEKQKLSESLLDTTDKEERRKIRQIIKSDGLSHHSLTCVTHFSCAWAKNQGFVIVCKDDNIRTLIFDFLVTTDRKLIWHNFNYDGNVIYYHTHKLPKNFEDTMLMAKTLTNNVNKFKYSTSLKDLMQQYYGRWAISKDYFTLEEMYNEDVIKYSCTDSCATYFLYQLILEEVSNSK